MSTQEERITDAEQDTKAVVKGIDFNINILKGIIRSQDQDIKSTLQRMDSLDKRLNGVDGYLNNLDGRLNNLDGRLATVEHDISQIKKTLNQQTELLASILARLQEKP